MTKKSREILDFVQSLEMHELNAELEGILITNPDNYQGGAPINSGGCSNTTLSCITTPANWECHNSQYSCYPGSNRVCSNSAYNCIIYENGLCSNGYTGGSSGRSTGTTDGGLIVDNGFTGILGL